MVHFASESVVGFRWNTQREPGKKVFPVLIVKENGAFFDTPDDDVLQ